MEWCCVCPSLSQELCLITAMAQPLCLVGSFRSCVLKEALTAEMAAINRDKCRQPQKKRPLVPEESCPNSSI